MVCSDGTANRAIVHGDLDHMPMEGEAIGTSEERTPSGGVELEKNNSILSRCFSQ